MDAERWQDRQSELHCGGHTAVHDSDWPVTRPEQDVYWPSRRLSGVELKIDKAARQSFTFSL